MDNGIDPGVSKWKILLAVLQREPFRALGTRGGRTGTRIGQHLVARGGERPYEMAAKEAGAAGQNNGHGSLLLSGPASSIRRLRGLTAKQAGSTAGISRNGNAEARERLGLGMVRAGI